jgi:hypothetical protein
MPAIGGEADGCGLPNLRKIVHRHDPPGGHMKRRGGSGKPAERRRAAGRKLHKGATGRTSIADLRRQLDQRVRKRDEALEQQAATSEVLKVISSSPGDPQPVFNAILDNATRICAAKFGILHLREGDAFRTSATFNLPLAFGETRKRGELLRPSPASMLGVS